VAQIDLEPLFRDDDFIVLSDVVGALGLRKYTGWPQKMAGCDSDFRQ